MLLNVRSSELAEQVDQPVRVLLSAGVWQLGMINLLMWRRLLVARRICRS